MIETESSIYIERLAERRHPGDRLSRIGMACQVFTRGFEEGDFTFEELREACRFLSKLIGSFDRDAGDLCLLASHAENVEQFQSICKLSRQHWEHSEDAEERVDDDILSRSVEADLFNERCSDQLAS
jgi:hypothetical protein